MYRIKMLFEILIILMLMCGCQSEAAKAVDEQILQIGTVTLDSREAIAQADKAVLLLNAEDRNTLKNLPVLVNAQKKIEILECEEAIDNISVEKWQMSLMMKLSMLILPLVYMINYRMI